MDLDNAIKYYNEFDWKKEFEEIEKREKQNLTPSYLEFLLRNTKTNEKLSITGTYIDEYEVTYEKEGKTGSEHILENTTRNSTKNSVQNIIIALFQHEVDTRYEYQDYKRKKYN